MKNIIKLNPYQQNTEKSPREILQLPLASSDFKTQTLTYKLNAMEGNKSQTHRQQEKNNRQATIQYHRLNKLNLK